MTGRQAWVETHVTARSACVSWVSTRQAGAKKWVKTHLTPVTWVLTRVGGQG